MARVPSAATAFAHRDAPFLVTIDNTWQGPMEAERHQAWTQQFPQALRPYGDGVYVSFLSDEGEGRVREAY